VAVLRVLEVVSAVGLLPLLQAVLLPEAELLQGPQAAMRPQRVAAVEALEMTLTLRLPLILQAGLVPQVGLPLALPVLMLLQQKVAVRALARPSVRLALFLRVVTLTEIEFQLELQIAIRPQQVVVQLG
jgi:hypothetical protein